jgi:predicted short-subunit dehydrogenase-like oxidoreductase (DUF2520 family)
VAEFRKLEGTFGREFTDADAILLCVPDAAVHRTAGWLTAKRLRVKGKVIAHVSGSLEAGVLAGLKRHGALVAALHPFFSFAGHTDMRLGDIPFSIEGSKAASSRVSSLFGPLGLKAAVLDPVNRPLYHAAAVFCSNFPAAFQVAAETLLRDAGFSAGDSRNMLSALLGSVVRNVKSRGARASLTGPVVRRDINTIERHFKALSRHRPSLLPSYSLMTLLLAEYTAANGDAEFMERLGGLITRHGG